MDLPSMPTDILDKIFSQHLGLCDLRALSVVSKECHAAAHAVSAFQHRYRRHGKFDSHGVGRVQDDKAAVVASAWLLVPFIVVQHDQSSIVKATSIATLKNIIGLHDTRMHQESSSREWTLFPKLIFLK